MKAFIVDVTDMDASTYYETHRYCEECVYFGQHTFHRVFQYEEDELDEFGNDMLPLTRAYVKTNNTENLPVFIHMWW